MTLELFCSICVFYVGSKFRFSYMSCILLIVRKSCIRVKNAILLKANNID